MPRHITVFPASTKAGRETIRQLLEHENGPIVRGIYRDPSKAPALFTANPRFEVTKGDVTTGAGLDFSSSDVVFYIPPPTYDGTETAEFATKTAHFVEKALKDAPSVKKLVLHSTLGAEFEHGTGILILNHITDKILKESVPEVIIVKPGYYFETWLPSLEEINAEPPTFDSPFYPPEHKFPMLSVHDIGEYCAKALLDDSQGPRLRYAELVGPESYSTLDLQKAIQLATGKNVAMNSIPKEELSAYFSKTLLPVYVPELVDLVKALSVGGLLAEGGYAHNEHTVVGKVDINDGVRRMLSESS